MSDESRATDTEVPLKQMWRFTEAGSDKDYLTTLEPVEGGLWIARYSNGKHGATLTTPRSKMPGPATYAEAKAAYDALCKERIKGRYVPQDNAGGGYVAPVGGRQASGILLQLLASIDEAEAASYRDDDRYIAQEKADGKRMAVQKGADGIQAIQRQGLHCGMPQEVCDAAAGLPGSFILDGEALGPMLLAFDILERDGRDLRGLPVEQRLAELADLLGSLPSNAAIRPVNTVSGTAAKVQLEQRVRATRGEGIVYKRLGSPYIGGEPGRNWHQVKHKFYATGSFIVGKINAKRSIKLQLLEDGVLRDLGNCTVPVNAEFPVVGQVVEIRYLYANLGGALTQPTYLGVRDDVAASECTTGQLKYKGDDTADED